MDHPLEYSKAEIPSCAKGAGHHHPGESEKLMYAEPQTEAWGRGNRDDSSYIPPRALGPPSSREPAWRTGGLRTTEKRSRLAIVLPAAVFFKGGSFPMQRAWGFKLLKGGGGRGRGDTQCLLLGTGEIFILTQ